MKRLVIETDRLASNIEAIKQEVGDCAIIGVVKANGYGLGAVQYSQFLLGHGISMLACARLDEARELREAGIEAEILLLSPVSVPDYVGEVVDLGLTAAIGSAESALALNTAAAERDVRVKAHLKIDTGFGRFGFLPEDVDKLITVCKSLTHVELSGIFTHLNVSFGDEKFCRMQFDTFCSVIDRLKQAGINPALRHIANSCAALRFPDMRLDAVRIGSAFLGRLPIKNEWGLKKVGHFEADIDEIRYLPKGHFVGYANVYKTSRPTRIAVVTAGAADGLALQKGKDAYRMRDRLRYLWNDFKFLLHPGKLACTVQGKRAMVLGRVGLTHTVIELGSIPAGAGDVAVFQVNPLYIDSSVERVYE